MPINSVISLEIFTQMYYFVVKGSLSDYGEPGGDTSSDFDIYNIYYISKK